MFISRCKALLNTRYALLRMLFLLTFCHVYHPAPAQTQKKYNVLFIAIDDLNDWTGSLDGSSGVKTPNLDRLAKRGMLFKRAYCTAPACNPSRASLLTGIRPSTSGVYYNNQPWRPAMPDAVTLPQHFTANDYVVAGIGKIFHIPYDDRRSWPDVHFPVPKSPQPANKPINGKPDDSFDWGALPVGDQDLPDYKIVQNAVQYLEASHSKPFFLAVGITKPHLPWYVPQRYFDLYPLEQIRRPATLETDWEDLPEAGIRMAETRGDHGFILKHNQWEKAVQGYLASISFADAQLGRLLDALDNSRYKENTIIVMFSDHGFHLGEKKHWRKFTLWEESTRVPFVVIAPGLTKPDQVCERTVSLLDIYPTLIDLCMLSSQSGLEGNSLVPLLKDPAAPRNDPAITTQGMGNHAVRTERWRYIRYNDGTEELYDHQTDPDEWHNLARKPEFTTLKTELAKWLPKINAPDAPVQKK